MGFEQVGGGSACTLYLPQSSTLNALYDVRVQCLPATVHSVTVAAVRTAYCAAEFDCV